MRAGVRTTGQLYGWAVGRLGGGGGGMGGTQGQIGTQRHRDSSLAQSNLSCKIGNYSQLSDQLRTIVERTLERISVQVAVSCMRMHVYMHACMHMSCMLCACVHACAHVVESFALVDSRHEPRCGRRKPACCTASACVRACMRACVLACVHRYSLTL